MSVYYSYYYGGKLLPIGKISYYGGGTLTEAKTTV